MMSSAEPAMQKVASEASSMAHELVEDVKPTLTEATTNVKERAHDAVETVKDA